MKIQVLEDLYYEVNRLFIAGSKFAKNDPRILKLTPVLKKMGEKAPVLGKLAAMTEELIAAEPAESMQKLTETGMFLYSILYTQGSAEPDKTFTPKPFETVLHTLPVTQTPYSRLCPIIEALTQAKPGRLNVLQDAYRRGDFSDFRLFPYMSHGLGDKYAEIVSFLSNVVIPSVGSPLIPYLLNDYKNPDKSGKQTARRLAALAALGYEKIEVLALEALNAKETDVSVQVEAIQSLSGNKAHEALFMALVEDRKADIREAALQALVGLGSSEGMKKMLKILHSKQFKPAIAAAAECKDEEAINEIFSIVKTYYSEIFTQDEDPQKLVKAYGNFSEILAALANKNDDAIYAFYEEILGSEKLCKLIKKSNLYYLYNSFVDTIHKNISKFKTIKELVFYERVCSKEASRRYERLPSYYFSVAVHYYDKAKIYNCFLPFYMSGCFDGNNLWNNEYAGENGELYENSYADNDIWLKRRKMIDERWLKAFLQKKQFMLYSNLLAAEDDEGCRYLLDEVKAYKKRNNLDRNLSIIIARLLEIGTDDERNLLADYAITLLNQYKDSNTLYHLYSILTSGNNSQKLFVTSGQRAAVQGIHSTNNQKYFIEICNYLEEGE